MENKQTAIEWYEIQRKKLIQDYTKRSVNGLSLAVESQKLFEQAKQMEKEQEYETKAYWFGRGVLASKENRIEELKPIKDK